MRCPTCRREGWDPRAEMAAMNARRDAFEASHRQIRCPSCRKRNSAAHNSVNAEGTEPLVEMVCAHCDHRYQVDR